MNEDFSKEHVLIEHRFWLQIMGDHSRFIFYSLAANEFEALQRSQDFIISYDHLLEQTTKVASPQEMEELSHQALQLTLQLRKFKLLLLSLSLESNIKTHLPPSFFNDMLNELEEYLLVINNIMKGLMEPYHPIHYHLLWLTDAINHAASVSSNLDFIEKDLINKSQDFELQFTDLFLKASMMNGYLRTQLDSFPGLSRLNEQVETSIYHFKEYLEHLRDMRMDGKALGTLSILMADHMAREECYYLWKLALTTGVIRRLDCDPARARIEL